MSLEQIVCTVFDDGRMAVPVELPVGTYGLARYRASVSVDAFQRILLNVHRCVATLERLAQHFPGDVRSACQIVSVSGVLNAPILLHNADMLPLIYRVFSIARKEGLVSDPRAWCAFVQYQVDHNNEWVM